MNEDAKKIKPEYPWEFSTEKDDSGVYYQDLKYPVPGQWNDYIGPFYSEKEAFAHFIWKRLERLENKCEVLK